MQKQKKLSRWQWAIVIGIGCAFLVSAGICSKCINLNHSDLTRLLLMIPFAIPIIYVCRNLERIAAADEFKDFLAISIGFVLSSWIPFLILASIVHFRTENMNIYPEAMIFLVIVGITGIYGLIFAMLLKKLGYGLGPGAKNQ